MSVEYCVIRVTRATFRDLQQRTEVLHDLMDAFYSASRTQNTSQDRDYVDSRAKYRDSSLHVPPVLRLLYVDEFTTSLLVDFMDEKSAFFTALVGWGTAHVLPGISYGYDEIAYYAPDDVKEVTWELRHYPDALLESRFKQHVDTFRIASTGYFTDDQAILQHQRSFAKLLRRLYDEAVHDADFVLLLTV